MYFIYLKVFFYLFMNTVYIFTDTLKKLVSYIYYIITLKNGFVFKFNYVTFKNSIYIISFLIY